LHLRSTAIQHSYSLTMLAAPACPALCVLRAWSLASMSMRQGGSPEAKPMPITSPPSAPLTPHQLATTTAVVTVHAVLWASVVVDLPAEVAAPRLRRPRATSCPKPSWLTLPFYASPMGMATPHTCLVASFRRSRPRASRDPRPSYCPRAAPPTARAAGLRPPGRDPLSLVCPSVCLVPRSRPSGPVDASNPDAK
jgi:hypothetical protein